MLVTGNVTRLTDFGAFVELEPGLEGLVHVSEMSNQRVRNPGDAAKIGQEVTVRILEVDGEARRMSLSMKQSTGSFKAPATAAAAAPATPAVKKKRPVLRGGLEF